MVAQGQQVYCGCGALNKILQVSSGEDKEKEQTGRENERSFKKNCRLVKSEQSAVFGQEETKKQ